MRSGRALLAAPVALILGLTLTAAPAEATYPGDPGAIAFGAVAEGQTLPDVHSVNPDGTGLRRLTDNPGFDACAAYDATGERIAFCSVRPSDPPGVVEIWTMRSDGSDERQLTDLGGSAVFPDFSPSGHRVAFNFRPVPAAGQAPEPWDIWEIRDYGRHPRNLTRTPDVEDSYPAYSPDGRWIAFIRFDADRTRSQVWVMDRNGRRQRQVTFDDTLKEQIPDWSPDGTTIAYGAGLPGDRDIWLVHPDGTGQRNLTRSADLQEYGPTWSPDGQHIAYLNLVSDTDRRVYTMRADGSGDRELVPQMRPLHNIPAWQPVPVRRHR